MEEKNIPTKKSYKGIIIAVCGVLILFGAVFGAYSYFNNPKQVMTAAINSLYNKVDDSLKELEKIQKFEFDPNKDSVAMDFNASLNTNYEEIKMLNGLKFGVNATMDMKNKKAIVGANVSENSKEIADGTFYFTDDKIYASIGKIFDKILLVEKNFNFDDNFSFDFSEFEDFAKNYSIDDGRYILKTIKDAFIDSLDKDLFETEKDTIELDGKDIDVKSITYVINKDVIKSLADKLLDDAKFIDKLSELSGLDKSEVKDGLKDLKNNDIEKFNLTIYTAGFFNTVSGLEIKSGKDFVRVISQGKFTEAVVKISGEEVKVFIEETDKDVFKIVAKNGKTDLFKATVKSLSAEKIDLSVETEDLSFSILLSLKTEKTKVSGDYEFKYDDGDIELAVKGSYSMIVNKAMNFPKFDDAIYYEDLSEEDLTEILDNLEAAIKNTSLEELLDAYVPTDEYDYVDTDM